MREISPSFFLTSYSRPIRLPHRKRRKTHCDGIIDAAISIKKVKYFNHLHLKSAFKQDLYQFSTVCLSLSGLTNIVFFEKVSVAMLFFKENNSLNLQLL